MAYLDRMDSPTLTAEQAFETAFRCVAQYFDREQDSELLMLMLVAMEPVTDHARTDDPASWSDWLRCVSGTLSNQPMPKWKGVAEASEIGTSAHLDPSGPEGVNGSQGNRGPSRR